MMVLIGGNPYPWEGPLTTFLLNNRKLFKKNELQAALFCIGVPSDLNRWEHTFGGPLVSGSKELAKKSSRYDEPLTKEDDGLGGVLGRSNLLTKVMHKVLLQEEQSPQLTDRITYTIEKSLKDLKAIVSHECKDFRSTLRDKLFTSHTKPPLKYYEKLPITVLLRLVSIGERASLFPSPAEKELACSVLAKRLTQLHQVSERKKYALKILSIPPLDPTLRDIATTCLAEAYHKEYGIDDNSENYRTKLLSSLEDELEFISLDLQHQVARKTANLIVSQRDLSFALRDLGKVDGTKNQAILTPTIKGAEALFLFAGQDKDRAQEIIDFLLSPLSMELIEDFQKKLKLWDPSEYNHRNAVNDYTECSEDTPEDVARKSMALYTLHRHFSLLPLEAKSFALKQILVAPERLYKDQDATYQHAITYTMDRLFPIDDTTGTAKEQETRSWCRLFMEAYVLSAHESERGFLLTAMLASSQSSSGKAVRPGLQLKRILEHLGPAYIKLGQAIHSYPGTPSDIKADLADLKRDGNGSNSLGTL
jgi:hypothetical protein